jgi:hypothetical protein
MPFIPGISDDESAISELLSTLAKIKVDFIMPGGLTLKPGRQKETFLSTIAAEFPLHLEQLTRLYSNDDFYGSPPSACYHNLTNTAKELAAANQTPVEVPHHLYRGQFARYDIIRILLGHMIPLYRNRGFSVASLKAARQRYNQWLQSRRQFIARRRNLSYSQIDNELLDAARSGRLGRILENQKLHKFLKQVLLENKTFDYTTLSLVDQHNTD